LLKVLLVDLVRKLVHVVDLLELRLLYVMLLSKLALHRF
jgi:hypothetical protein